MNEASEAIADDMAREQAARKQSSGDITNETTTIGYSYNESGNMTALYAALSAAQGAFLPAKKTATNPHFRSKFAPLEEVIAATRDGLAANGLAVIQPTVQGPEGLYLVTKLTHSEGGAIETIVPLGKFSTVHELASKITYLKRYTRSALLSVASDEDDDGNEAVEGDKAQAKDRTRPAPPPKPAGAPATTPRKPPAPPQEAPRAAEAPKPQPEPQSAPQAKSELPPAPTTLLATADKLADMKSLFVSLQFKGTPAKECVGLLTGKDAGNITNPDVERVCLVLRAALASRWDADRLMLLVRETPEAEAAVRAIEEETAAMGGAS